MKIFKSIEIFFGLMGVNASKPTGERLLNLRNLLGSFMFAQYTCSTSAFFCLKPKMFHLLYNGCRKCCIFSTILRMVGLYESFLCQFYLHFFLPFLEKLSIWLENTFWIFDRVHYSVCSNVLRCPIHCHLHEPFHRIKFHADLTSQGREKRAARLSWWRNDGQEPIKIQGQNVRVRRIVGQN